jgi:hypothetical protein
MLNWLKFLLMCGVAATALWVVGAFASPAHAQFRYLYGYYNYPYFYGYPYYPPIVAYPLINQWGDTISQARAFGYDWGMPYQNAYHFGGDWDTPCYLASCRQSYAK